MPQLAHRLTNLTIKFISLVEAGANRREFVRKSLGGGRVDVALDFAVRKLDDEQRRVLGVLYVPGEVDTQGDFVTEADLDAAMADFMAKGRAAAGVAGDVDHNEEPTADYFTQVFKVEAHHVGTNGITAEDVGAWAVERQVVDPSRWEAVKSGTYNALSFGGTAERVFDQEVTKARRLAALDKGAMAAKVAGVLSDLDKGLVAEMLERNQVPRLLEAIGAAMWEAYYSAPADSDEEKAALREVLEEAINLSKGQTMKHEEKKSLLQKLASALGLSGDDLPTVEDPKQDLPAEPLTDTEKAVGDAVDAAVKAKDAEHVEAVEALKTEHAAKIAELEQKIEALEKETPGSRREDVTDPPGGKVSGGVFAGRM